MDATTTPAAADPAAADRGLRRATVDSPLGPLRVVVDDAGALAGLYLPDHRPEPSPAALGREVDEDDPALAAVAGAVLAYLDGAATAVEVPMARVAGTAFQHAVWEEVAGIPYGGTRTYGQVAAALGRPTAVRAVGAAIARNPRCVVVPCHRVVAAGGAVIGHAGGVERKRWLLDLEARGTAELGGGPAAGLAGNLTTATA